MSQMKIRAASASQLWRGASARCAEETRVWKRSGVRARSNKALTLNTLNPNIVKLKCADRGPLVERAEVLEKELAMGALKPFKHVIKANIGDGHALGQRPITYLRQVVACVAFPDLLTKSHIPADVKERAQLLLDSCGGKSMGSYSASHGLEVIRRHVADYIEARDSCPADWRNVCLSAGASRAIKLCLSMFCNDLDGKPSGVLVPVPQYPMYSAALAEFGLVQVDYFLDEERNWGLKVPELQRAVEEASKRCNVRAIVVINPGNPTGQVLTYETIKRVIHFCREHGLFIFADEVHQDNVYAPGCRFHSFKKVLTEMGCEYKDQELASFNSISKGYVCEGGLRGGWVELCNVDPEVRANLDKAISVSVCPTTLGQTAVDCVVKPPMPGEPSYCKWIFEKIAVQESLKQKAHMIASTFNSMPGFQCNIVQGALYAFPRIVLPPRAVDAAVEAGMTPDVFYACKLLEEAGVCVMPGSGFGQRPDTYHFRTTILPQHQLLMEMLDVFRKFHNKFIKEYC
ncbi:alanine aminotransferase 1-like [Pectinophora gossypiella]|uniref:alanine aminotransferase 1-like n=1 Tax=Pectinophora gossypiella TaxID=13191 RepID=UPI00214ED9FF|nr:alanine aminotransferase 1-like [Pectinophora gossypiella]